MENCIQYTVQVALKSYFFSFQMLLIFDVFKSDLRIAFHYCTESNSHWSSAFIYFSPSENCHLNRDERTWQVLFLSWVSAHLLLSAWKGDEQKYNTTNTSHVCTYTDVMHISKYRSSDMLQKCVKTLNAL